MKQTTEDDALIGLLFAVILQAVDDYRHLHQRGCITPDGEVLPYKFGRIRRTRSYHHCDGMTKDSEAFELKEFFTKWGLDLLCDLTGHQACRIRRKLGLVKEVL